MRLTTLLALTEALLPFGADDIAKLRADFLMIMKNVERVATYEAAVQLQNAMTTWRQHFSHTIDDIIAGIPEVTKGVGHDGYWKKEIGTGTWDLHIYFKLPLDTPEGEAQRWQGTGMRSATPEELFARFARERTKWAAKMKDAARKAWTVLKKYLEWASDHAKGPVVKNSPPIEMATLAGFKVKLVGDKRYKIELIKAALASYRARAMKVFPWLVQHQLPLVFEFDSDGDWAGRYKHTYIKISPSLASAEDLPRTLAHEMGHHAWAVYLSSADKTFWRAAIAHHRVPLDLNHLISIWPAGKHNHSIFDLGDYLKVHDPVMFLQVQALEFGYGLHASADFTSYEGVLSMIDRGIKSVPVPSNPITAYAEKNPEEAFCEAIGMLVAYGPRALMPAVRSWLALILPAVRMEGKALRGAPVLG